MVLLTQFLLTLSITCMYQIQFTYGGSSSSSVLGTDFSVSSNSTADRYIAWLNLVNAGIDEFIREYESQHQTRIVKVHRDLNRPEPAIPDSIRNSYYQTFLMKFSYVKNTGEVVESSVHIDMAEFGQYYLQGKVKLFYAKEEYMYREVLPLMYKSWQHENLSPHFYASKESRILILENLRNASYALKDSLIGSVEECKFVFQSLAQFHSLSHSRLNEDVYVKLGSLTATEILQDTVVAGTDALEIMINYGEQLLALQSLSENMKNEIRDVLDNLGSAYNLKYSPSPNGFNVVLHGTPNRMTTYFLYDEPSGTTKCKFVDFRLSRQGSPVLDLMIYLITSVKFEVFKMYQDFLFTFYLEELSKNLTELMKHDYHYDLSSLRADLKYYKPCFIHKLMYHVPILWADKYSGSVDVKIQAYSEALRSNEYISFLKNWMEVFLSW